MVDADVGHRDEEVVSAELARDVCVIGGAGFLGTNLVRALVAKGKRVVVIDPAAREVPGAHVVPAVVTDEVLRSLIGNGWRPRGVFHLGGSGSVARAAEDPEGDYERTVVSSELLLRYFVGPDARLVFVSSAAVYGDAGVSPIGEDCSTRPISHYGVNKLHAEELIQRAGGSFAIVRFFSLYGPGLRKQLLWDACRKLKGPSPTFDGTGAERRDWMQVDDAVRLLLLVAEADRSVIVNGGTGVGTRVDEALRLLQQSIGTKSSPRFTNTSREGDPQDLVADVGLARTLGFAPEVSLEQGLAAYARWFESQA